MTLFDLVMYILVIILVVLAISMEAKHYVCDTGPCAILEWAKYRANNDKEKYINLIEYTTQQSVWMRAFIASTVITAVTFWWFTGTLPPFFYFLGYLIFIFVIMYFIFTFYQHHFLAPVNKDVKDYIKHNCTDDDVRLPDPSSDSTSEDGFEDSGVSVTYIAH